MTNKRRNRFIGNENVYCGICEHCYSHHSPALNGSMILGKCPYKEFSVFLRWDSCDKFMRKNQGHSSKDE